MPPADRAPRRPPRPAPRRGALARAPITELLAGLLVVVVAAFLKGAIGFGFPLVATPALALVVDVQTAVAVTILPNIVMDGVQASRRRGLVGTLRRWGVMLLFGTAGMVLGTRLLVVLPAPVATTAMGVFVLLFVALNLARLPVRVPPASERWLTPPVGFLAGVVGGVTNVPGTPLVIFFYALGLDKVEFVRSVAVTFLVYKIIQLAAVAWYGLLDWRVVGASLALSAVAVVVFTLGARLQDRLAQHTFNRVVLIALGLIGLWLVASSAQGLGAARQG